MERAISNETITRMLNLVDDSQMRIANAPRGVLDISNLENHAKKFNDSYFESINRLGGLDFSRGDFGYENLTLNFGLWIVLYTTNWTFRRIIDKPSEDMIKKGITLYGSMNSQDKKRVYNAIKSLNKQLIYSVIQGRLFGGGISVILIEGVPLSAMSKPLDLKKIKKGSKIRLETYDRWFGVSNISDGVVREIGEDYGTPEYYTINLNSNNSKEPLNVKIHHSWCIRLRNREAPRIIKQQLFGWDLAEGSHLYEELKRSEKIKATIPALLDKSLTEIFKMNGIQGLFSGMSGVEQKQIDNRLSMITKYRTYRNITFLETTDDYQQFQYNPSGLDGVMEEFKDQIAGCAEMPRVMLYGETKGGLTSDSPAELEIYDSNINSKQENIVRPMFDKLLPVIYAVLGIEPTEDTFYDFNPIREVSVMDKQKRLEKLMATSVLGVQNGIISPRIAAQEIKKMSAETGYGDYITDEFINKLSDEAKDVLDPNNFTNIRIKQKEEGVYTETHNEKNNKQNGIGVDI